MSTQQRQHRPLLEGEKKKERKKEGWLTERGEEGEKGREKRDRVGWA